MNRIKAAPEAWAFALLLGFAALIWLPALATPFWGDDYVYLYAAHAANASAQPWLQTFWPLQPLQFWRPLSQEAYWRVVEGALHANALSAHAVNLALHACAAASVGALGGALARACRWERARWIGALSAGLYAISAVGLLPVHWVASANSPLLVALTALALAAWLPAAQARGAMRVGLLAAIPLLLVLGLLSKESAVLTPLLMLLLGVFAGVRPRRGDIVAWLACIAVVLAWLCLRARVTVPPPPEYAYAFGANIARNVASLCAWLLNVPREALRLLAVGQRLRALAWIAATVLPLLAAWALALREGGLSRLQAKQWRVLAAFVVLAYAPYFPLAWNSYEYYAAVAAILPAIVLARLLAGRRRVLLVALLLGASSWLAVAGTRWLDHPGMIGRARWAESVFRDLQASPVRAPLFVQIADAQRFYAIGDYGLAWRLGLKPEDIRHVDVCPADANNCLVIDADGRWRWAR